MLKSRYPHLIVRSVRGNVGTRLSKLDAGQFDALIMAGAGLKRLGLSDRIRKWLPPEVSLPAPGQGALGIEIRSNDERLARLVAFLNDEKTRAACSAALVRCRLLRMPSTGTGTFGFGLLSEIIEPVACSLLKNVPRTHKPKSWLRVLSGNY